MRDILSDDLTDAERLEIYKTFKKFVYKNSLSNSCPQGIHRNCMTCHYGNRGGGCLQLSLRELFLYQRYNEFKD